MPLHSGKTAHQEQLKLMLPVIVPVLLLSIIPLARGIYFGFTDYRLGDPARFNGLENYLQLAGDAFFWQSFRAGFMWTIAVTAGQVILGLVLAILLNTKMRFT